MSENLSRRGILTLGSFAGGLLLPFAGGKALSILDPAAADPVRVLVSPYPKSLEIRAFWQAVETADSTEHDFVRDHGDRPIDEYLAITEHQKQLIADAAGVLWERPVLGWGDVADLAEVAWHYGSKEKAFTPKHPGDRPTGRLYRKNGYSRHLPPYRHALSDHAANMLIEGVLTLTGGRRYDPYIAGYERDFGQFVSWENV